MGAGHPPAHPRRCGAHDVESDRWNAGQGSSPQVRGSRPLTPCGGTGRRAHPRRCGAHPDAVPAASDDCGSSPQVRGSLPWCPASTDSPEAHPRRCGAHVYGTLGPAEIEGSSPQVRGSHGGKRLSTVLFGLIPAGAGLTRPAQKGYGCAPAHPRRCGAHSTWSDGSVLRRGSSPQVRGSPTLTLIRDGHRGLIPAGAGLTLPEQEVYQPVTTFTFNFQRALITRHSYLSMTASLLRPCSSPVVALSETQTQKPTPDVASHAPRRDQQVPNHVGAPENPDLALCSHRTP